MANYFNTSAGGNVGLTDGVNTGEITPIGALGVGFPLWTEGEVKTKSWNSSSSTTLHTVAAGKKCYILGFVHSISDYGNSRSGSSTLTSSAGVLSIVTSASYSSTGGATGNSSSMDLTKMPLVLAAGETISYSLATANKHAGVVYYLEVDA